MRDKINFWTDVPGRQVDTIEWKPGDTSVWFRFEEGVLEVESSDPGMPLRLDRSELVADTLDLLTLSALKVTRVVVPYIAAGHPDDAAVVISFEDGQVIRVASENPTIPIRIS